MSPASPYILLMLAMLLTVALLIVIPETIKRRKHRQQWRVLLQKVMRYRLSKMLAFLGIDPAKYVRHIPEQVIAQHIARCHTCPNIPDCDRCLRDGRYVPDMHFCPNFQSLMYYSRTMPPAAPP
jgi:hypothetical protein